MKKDPFKNEYEATHTGSNKEKYENLPDFPLFLDIELCGGICQSACKICAVGRDNINKSKGLPLEFKRQRGFMDEFLFLRILGEIKDKKTPIRLVGWGEPTIHPKFWHLVRKAKSFGIKIHLNTNGMLLRALREPLDSIKLSAHSNSKRVREGVDSLLTMNCFRSASITNEEAEEFDIDITKYPFTELDRVKQYRQFFPGMDAPRPSSCEEMHKLTIFWDGWCSFCCSDVNGQMIVGDLHNESLQEIWHGEKIEKYRKLIAAEKHWNLPLCKDCRDLGAT
jgi:MoaA/NifB/PqqE/SkfB family radical SAM enzyme